MVEPWSDDRRPGQEGLRSPEDTGIRRPCAVAASALCSPRELASVITAIRLVVLDTSEDAATASCENTCPNAQTRLNSYAGAPRGCALAVAGTAMLAAPSWRLL